MNIPIMFLHEFYGPCAHGESMKIKLPGKNLQIDPRANFPHRCEFTCRYHDDGETITLTRVDNVPYEVGRYKAQMRVYNPAKGPVPDFESRVYRYYGIIGEKAPPDTVIGIVDASAKIIRERAFSWCRKMERIVFHKNVETIEECAFIGCICLHGLFLPSSIKKIEDYAFAECKTIRILSMPVDIDALQHLGRRIIEGCDTLLNIICAREPLCELSPFSFHTNGTHHQTASKAIDSKNDDVIYQTMIDFQENLSPLYKTCLSFDVSATSIRQCIATHGLPRATYNGACYNGMTPMHIIALNPHADLGSIHTCLEADMSAAFVSDNRNKTPLDYLREYNMPGLVSVIQTLCHHREYYSHVHHTVATDSRKRRRKY